MRAALLIGRLLFGGFFLFSGLNHFVNAQQLAQYAASQHVPVVLVPVSGALIAIAGLHVLFGVMPRFGLLLAVLFLVPVTFAMHRFWADTDPQQRLEDLTELLKNLAMIGAALGWLAVPVPWPFSVDEALERRGGDVGRPITH